MLVRDLDWRSPLDAFAPLAAEPFACLLHAGDKAAACGWSILAAFPSRRFEGRQGRAFMDGRARDAAPFDALRDLHLARASDAQLALDAPFLTGLIGFAGYELGGALEPSARGPPSPFALPDLAFGAYDAAALFDRASRRAYVVGRDPRGIRRLEEALGRDAGDPPPAPRFAAPRANFTADDYRSAVTKMVELIRGGAFFQANLSQQVVTESLDPYPPFSLFRRLAEGGATFGAYLNYPEGAILSNSPERFFSLSARDRHIRAEPIKGTRARGRTPQEDTALAEELCASPKERAENVMIADLSRNDLSRICEDGSIREDDICALISGPDVHHLVSKISGRLAHGLTAADALAALFPCGSVTGAPKIEAMKTIAEIEGRGRGPYCGAMGYIDDRGGADFSVAIRLMIAERAGDGLRVTLPVGGGITLRSDPDAEYRETWLKARNALAALGLDAP